MYTDKQRIEDSIIPGLLLGVMYSHVEKDSAAKEAYKDAIKVLHKTIDKYLGHNKMKLGRRLDRAINKISTYFVKEKFTTRKSILAVSEWNRALLAVDAVVVEDDEYKSLLQDIDRIIMKNGYGEIENFEKIDASAINHVPKMHKLAQNNGYFE